MNLARALAAATLVALVLSGCVRLDLQTTPARGAASPTAESTPTAVGPTATAEATPVPAATPTAEATPTAGANPADGVISDWGTPVTLATILVLMIGGLVAYMVSRRQRKAADQTQA